MNVKIEKLVYGGEGIGHAEGNTVFVPFVLPGEEVAIRAVERKKKFVRGAISQIVKPAPERIHGECPHFAVCGGCHYQHIPYGLQLEAKKQILRETLSRLGRITWDGPIEAHDSPPYAYRNRAQWKVRWVDEPGRHRGIIGYHRAASSAIFNAERCPILLPSLQAALQSLRTAIEGGELPSTLREVEAFANPAGEILFNASFTAFEGSGKKWFETLRAAVPSAASLLLHNSQNDSFHLEGPGFIDYPVGEFSYRVGHLSFFQVNHYLLEKMTSLAAHAATGDLALDLFAGVGLFSLPLAGKFQRVISVESNEAGVRDLRINAKRAALPIQCVTQEAERFLAACKESPQLIVLDPPRAGIGAEAAKHLRRLAPQEITYVSCDPATLARDLAALLAADSPAARYEIGEIHLLDMFPQTFHIESLVRLRRH